MAPNYKRYNPAVSARMKVFSETKQWELLPEYLDSLSHAHFYTASFVLGDSLLPKMDAEEFWMVTTLLYKYSARAFLRLCMKVAARRQADLERPEAEAMWKMIAESPVESEKTLLTLLAEIKDNVSLVEHLLNVMLGDNPRDRIALLLRVNTPAAAYLLLLAMRRVEEDRTLLLRTTYFLIKRGDALSFNMASLFKVFFGLDEVRGTFSLKLEPFELSRLESSYEAFKARVVNETSTPLPLSLR